MTLLLLQLVFFCALFTGLVRMAAGSTALNCLYFYPKSYQEQAYRLGLTDRETVARKRRRFMLLFFLVMSAALLLIIGAWNAVRDFWPAYGQALLFLEVMNWFDGIVIDRLWVGRSSFWVIPGMEGVPYVQTWPQVLRKRGILSVIWIAGAGIAAGLIFILHWI